MLFGTMNPNLGTMAARIAGLLVLAAILGAGVQAAVAEEEQTMNIGISNFAGIGNDPTIYQSNEGDWPIQDHHHYTHW